MPLRRLIPFLLFSAVCGGGCRDASCTQGDEVALLHLRGVEESMNSGQSNQGHDLGGKAAETANATADGGSKMDAGAGLDEEAVDEAEDDEAMDEEANKHDEEQDEHEDEE